MNQLNNIKKFTNIAIDTGNLELIAKYSPKDVTTNPSLICKEVQSHIYQEFVNDAIYYANKKGGNKKIRLINANDKLFVNISKEILKLISGHVSIELDVRLSFDYLALIKRAKKIISLCKNCGIEKSRILIKLAATWEGIKAAETLEKSGINCNLTLIFSLIQARACAEARVYLISPFIGRVSDWYVKNKKIKSNNLYLDPGIKLAYKIYNFYRQRNYKTIMMGASFRNLEQIYSLVGYDAITISPIFFEQLNCIKKSKIYVLPKINSNLNRIKNLSEAKFRWQYNCNTIAIEKLSEGIRLFFNDQKKIDNFLSKYL
ncbi:MAG: hypothetical protein O5V64_171 [Wigglesworthia glossinidia]|nr:hypothetical protein [Wigglesworthia glossinidia]